MSNIELHRSLEVVEFESDTRVRKWGQRSLCTIIVAVLMIPLSELFSEAAWRGTLITSMFIASFVMFMLAFSFTGSPRKERVVTRRIDILT